MRRRLKEAFSAGVVLGVTMLLLMLQSQDGHVHVAPRPFSNNLLYPSNISLLDLKDFRYVLNNACSGSAVLLLLVTSNARNRDLRQAQRDAFPASKLASLRVCRRFLLAADRSLEQAEVERESEQHKDIIQGNFAEAYRNLTYKHVMGLQWAIAYSHQARWVVKMDDDIIVDIYQLLDKLSSQYPVINQVMYGFKQIGLSPQRDPANKWFVSREEFAQDTYPDFLSGWAYVLSPFAASLIVRQAQKEKFFWIDDVWVTGMLAAKAGLQIQSLNTFYTVHREHMECCVSNAQADGETYFCDFMVGPSGDDRRLIRDFGRVSELCSDQRKCQRRTWQKSIIKTCVHVVNPYFLPETKGVGQVINLNQKAPR